MWRTIQYGLPNYRILNHHVRKYNKKYLYSYEYVRIQNNILEHQIKYLTGMISFKIKFADKNYIFFIIAKGFLMKKFFRKTSLTVSTLFVTFNILSTYILRIKMETHKAIYILSKTRITQRIDNYICIQFFKISVQIILESFLNEYL